MNNEQEVTSFGGFRPLFFRFKGLVYILYSILLVYYLSYLIYILVDFNFLYAPSITEVSSAFKKIWVGCISNFEDIVLILFFWLCDKYFDIMQ